MSKSRTWSIRLSVDDLNASFCLLETDQEIAAWVRGLMRGLNAGDCKEEASTQYVEGWEIGRPARERADEIRSGCAETGRIGGSKRVANAQANASPDASPIAQPVAQPERRTKNEEQETKERKQRFVPPTGEQAAEYAQQIGFGKVEAWMAYYQANGWRAGKNKMSDWRGAMRYWLQKDGAAGAVPTRPTIAEWMQEGESVAMSNATRFGTNWPRDLCRAAFYQCASNDWRGVANWREKLRAECLRWVGNENGRLR